MSDVVRTFASAGRLALGRLWLLGSRQRPRVDQASAPGPRGRLFRKYVLLFIGLVSFVLLLNSALDFWFTYDENKAALFLIQQEKAGSAARRIEQFVDEFERQLGWTTAPQWAAGPLEQRKFDYVRLLRQVPAITELIQLDDSGKEQLKVSRLAIDVIGSEKDYSETPSFIEARKHRVWFSPVYFRKESEPYMTLAMARAGRNAGVTIAEVNLKLIWDVITGLKIGQSGYAYVVDREGRLIAHPDISLVLRNTDLAKLPQVAATHSEGPGGQPASSPVMIAKSVYGGSVLTAHAAIAPLGWTVFVELPLSEALAPLYGSALRTAALLALALGLATLAALILARRMTVPIRLLQAGAARIGAGELDRRIDIHTGDELEGLAGEFNRMAEDLQKSYAGLEKKVEERTAELTEALDQQTATAEVLGVINSSPGDLAPVFDAMLDKAMRLCSAAFGYLMTYDGERFQEVAHRGLPPRFAEYLPRMDQPGPSGAYARIKAGAPLVHIADLKEGDVYLTSPLRQALVDLGGARTSIIVALRKDEALLGVLTIYRQEVRPFTEKQIALLQNFAAQAVIAMENARLITETREALEQQTATAEVLQVINSSPGDLTPVFQAIVEKAHTLCGAACGSLQLWDGEKFRGVAMRGFSEAMVEQLRAGYDPSDMPCQRVVEGERVVHCVDLAAIDSPVAREGGVKLAGIRSILYVALRKDDVLLGQIVAARQEVRPFSEKEIALVESFAAQAVIAMENARLITETREALEQQTATAEVLGVINSSPGDLAPVFDAMLDKAIRLSEATHSHLFTYDGDLFYLAAARGEPRYIEWQRQAGPVQPYPSSPLAQIKRGQRIVHVADIREEEVYRALPIFRESADLRGVRSQITVALIKDNILLGAMVVYRREVRPFSDKQIALLQNFAAQAVIAIENTRLINETREALDQQTATAEVLGVINSSPGDLAPVFNVMLEKATRLCEAPFGILRTWDGECFHFGAVHGEPRFRDWVRQRGPIQTDSDASLLGRIQAGERVVHIIDAQNDEGYRASAGFREMAEASGIRSAVTVALHKDDALLGIITVYRQEVRPFSDKQIALLENFAAQAVIAMENARLLGELRERTRDLQESLEYQTATSDVLRVISQSGGELEPVLDTLLETGARLCKAEQAVIALRSAQDGLYRYATSFGYSAEFKDLLVRNPVAPGRGSLIGRTALEGQVVHLEDAVTDPEYTWAEALQHGRWRTGLGVPLLRDGSVVGTLALTRTRIERFTDKQIELVKTFADQAVIAMENARLITETREALEQQTATAEVLGVINSSPGDLAPVFEAILEKAHSLCGAAKGALMTYDGEHFRAVATRGMSEAFATLLREPQDNPPGSPRERLLRGESFVHVADFRTIDLPIPRAAAELEGARTVLFVPLRKDRALLGYITVYRQEIRPFSDKEIALLQNFAAQAVIAMENTRLITETRESLEYQTATSDVLKVISQSTFDLQPVLETLAETAARLCDAEMAFIFRRQGDLYRVSASVGFSPETKALVEANPISPGRGTVAGRTALTADVVHIPDARLDPEYTWGEFIRVARTPTMLGVPLLREGVPIGVIVLARQRVEPFTEKQIALVSTFADQAVIAIENARLFNELRDRTAELGRSVEELKMLSEVGQAVSSTLDLRSVLSTILTSSLGLTVANAGAIFRYSRAERAFRLVEAVGWDEALTHSVEDLRLAETETAMGEAVARRMPVQLADTAQRASNPLRDLTLAAGFHSALIVPLVGAERILGALLLMRQEAGEFPHETVRLMQTLASQSVLAIQNARLFREIADKSEQLALASQHKSQFLANMSHELRTPLNAILGYAELLVDGIYGVLPDRPKGVLERIQNNGRHLLALINDVLDLAKIEAGQLTLTLEDYSLPEVVRSVVTATEPLATGKGLKFTAALQEDMPKGHGDARRLSQVLLNLVGNAIKFTDQGEVEIRGSADRGQFVLEVRDTGPGIPDADQDRIFGEFQQIDNSNTRQKGGTGLGLAISKRMVEMQGGTIAVESVLGQGSTFRVVLPVHVDEMMEAAE
jgi:GAF domain-containing protein/HAMP domain-containing protein